MIQTTQEGSRKVCPKLLSLLLLVNQNKKQAVQVLNMIFMLFFLWTSSDKMISSMGELISVVFLEAIVNLLNQINYCQLKTVCTFELLTAFENERIINDNNYFSTQLKIALYFYLFFFLSPLQIRNFFFFLSFLHQL